MKRAWAILCVVTLGFFGSTARAEAVEWTEFPAVANGDTNGDWARDLSDVIYLFGFLYQGGDPPVPLLRVTDLPGLTNGDANGDGTLDISDPIYIVRWLFLGGAEPVSVLNPARIPALGQGAAYESPITGTYVFPNIPLHEVEPWIAVDHGIDLGGVGSDLFYDRRHGGSGGYWLATDLGAAGRAPSPGARNRTLVVPEYSPMILEVSLADGVLNLEKALPLVGGKTGKRITGLSNIDKTYDYARYDWTGTVGLPYDPDALDPEGLVRTSAGDFWICEEFGSSIVHIDGDGKVLKRFVPAGWGPKVDATKMAYELSRTLPGIFTLRQRNNGFEGLAINKEETTLYIALQCPLDNPKGAGPASRITRFLVFDIASEKVVAEYVYRFEDVNVFDPQNVPPNKQDEMKISSLVALNKNMLLVNERTDWVARVYMVNMTKATNILGTKWDDPATSPSLESLTDPAAAGVAVLPKKLFVDLNLPGMPGKIEGMAMLDEETLGVTNDNDFGLDGDGKFDANGNNIDSGIETKLILINLNAVHVDDDGKGKGNMPHDEDD
jgi:hypothetical protein